MRESLKDYKILSQVGTWVTVTCVHCVCAAAPNVSQEEGSRRTDELKARVFARARDESHLGDLAMVTDTLKTLIRATLVECLAELDSTSPTDRVAQSQERRPEA